MRGHSPSVGSRLVDPDDRDPSGVRRKSVEIGQFLSAKVQFFFYLLAWLFFLAAALLPAGRGPRLLGRVNLVALGLALAVAPSMYIYFKAGFPPEPYFH